MSDAIATNKQAFRDYFVLETIDAGIELKGGEVKSLRQASVSMKESFARVEKGQVIMYGVYISPYAQASYLNVEATRARRLLLHKGQIKRMDDETSQKHLAIIPLKMYFNSKGYAKVELGLCKGKRQFDKRDDIKKRETDRKIKRMLRSRG
jgi:SsrA-binding protein